MGDHLPGRGGAPLRRHAPRLLTALALLLCCPPTLAGQAEQLSRAGLSVHYPTGLGQVATRALDLAEEEIPRLAGRLQLKPPRTCQIYLARKDDHFPPHLARHMPGWAAGLTLPFSRTILVRLDRLNSPLFPGGFREVMKHELVHFVMGSMSREAFTRLHWWFHEGTAQVLSSSLIFLREARLGDLAASGRLRSVARLGIEENPSRRATDLAYQEAFSFATFLEGRLGKDFFARLIKAMEQRPDFNLAFLTVTNRSYVTLEEEWKELLLSQPRATIQRLARDFFWLVLILAVPLVLLALRRRRRRDRRLEEAWQREEDRVRRLREEGEEDWK